MIKSITVTNYKNEQLTLELRNPYNTGLAITNITGLGPSKATVNTTDLAYSDGAVFNSARVGVRNIVISFQLLPDPETGLVEDVRRRTYKYFPIKKPLRLTIETDHRTADIDGYVESNEPDIFQKDETIAISILCPFPWFYTEGENIILNAPTPEFSFPFSNESLYEPTIEFGQAATLYGKEFDYNGDVETGAVFHIYLKEGAVKKLSLSNTITDETMNIDTSIIGKIMGEERYLPLLFGGRGTAVNYRNEIHLASYDRWYRLDSDTDEWIKMENLPFSIWASCSGVVFDDKIYMFNWDNKWIMLTEDESKEPSITYGGTTPLSYSVGMSCVVHDDVIHLLSQTQHYKMTINGWTSVSTIPYKFKYGASVSFNNKLHILGSDEAAGQMVGSGLMFNLSSKNWKQNDSLRSPMYVERDYIAISDMHTTLIYNNEIHIMGGPTGVAHYKYDGRSWTLVSTLPFTYIGKVPACAHQGHIIIWGGGDTEEKNFWKWDGNAWSQIYYGDGQRFHISAASLASLDDNIYIVGRSWVQYNTGLKEVAMIQPCYINFSYDKAYFYQWWDDPNLSCERQSEYGNVVAKNGKVYFMCDDQKLYTYDIQTRYVTQAATSDTLIWNWYPILVGDDLYAYDRSGKLYILYEYWKYGFANMSEWRLVANPMPRFDQAVGAVYYNNAIQLVDCKYNKPIPYGINHYSWDGSAWNNESTLPYNFNYGAAVVYDDTIHILGGLEGKRKHYKLDTSTNKWVLVSTLPYNFFNGAALVKDNMIHIFGGDFDEDGTYATKHYMWNGTHWIIDKDSNLQVGDDIYLSTVENHRYMHGYRDGKEYNLLSAIPKLSDWIHIQRGRNNLVYGADEGADNIVVDTTYRKLYEGM